MALVCFDDMEVLAGRARSDEARALLLKTAKQVEPIMKKRGWTVGRLKEIVPPSPNLLGWNENRGAVIAIRVRRVHDVDSFFDFQHVLGTMLHELCHIAHGPHNASFYALLDELWGEAEALMDKGVVGLGAFESGTGQRAGGIARPLAAMRDAQVQAALKRQRIGSLMGGASSGKRLGGSLVGKDVRVLAAEAAERRAADDIWCHDLVDGGEGATHKPAEVDTHKQDQRASCAKAGLSVSNVSHAAKSTSAEKAPKDARGDGGGRHMSGAAKRDDGAGARQGKDSASSAARCMPEMMAGDQKGGSGYSVDEGLGKRNKEGGEASRDGQDGSKRPGWRQSSDVGRKSSVIDLTKDDSEDDSDDDCLVIDSDDSTADHLSTGRVGQGSRCGSGLQMLTAASCPRCSHVNFVKLSDAQDALCDSCGALLAPGHV